MLTFVQLVRHFNNKGLDKDAIFKEIYAIAQLNNHDDVELSDSQLESLNRMLSRINPTTLSQAYDTVLGQF